MFSKKRNTYNKSDSYKFERYIIELREKFHIWCQIPQITPPQSAIRLCIIWLGLVGGNTCFFRAFWAFKHNLNIKIWVFMLNSFQSYTMAIKYYDSLSIIEIFRFVIIGPNIDNSHSVKTGGSPLYCTYTLT